MVANILIYEDEHFNRLYPLSLTRPVYLLRCGISLLLEKIMREYPAANVHLYCRNYVAAVVREQYPAIPVNHMEAESCLLINGRFLPAEELPQAAEHDLAWRCNGEFVAAFLRGPRLRQAVQTDDGTIAQKMFNELPARDLRGTLISYPWDLVQHNAGQIVHDFSRLNVAGQLLGKLYPNTTLLDKKNIFVGSGAKIKPGAVLDAEEGPIYVGAGTTVMANACMLGPCAIGENSLIKMGAKIYEGVSTGERCKVGGEVEASIIHSYSNKQHEGFMGHSYLGQWVNIGADSNNSDLKNNYGTVRVYVDGEMVDTGLTFVGMTIGDHAKCGINTMFNTGSVVGVMSNVFGAGYPPKFIPAFTWGGIEELKVYDCHKALATARRVMKRRQLEMSAAQEDMLRKVFAITEKERAVAAH